MTTYDTFQAGSADIFSSEPSPVLSNDVHHWDTHENVASDISSGKDSHTDEDGSSKNGARTLRAALPDFLDSDYASSISFRYTEEDTDKEVVSKCDKDVLQEETSIYDFLVDIYHPFPKGVMTFQSCMPCKHKWKRDWPEEGKTTAAWVNVYGFFDGMLNSGGYGVIVRNKAAQPIAASVYYTRRGVTYLSQVLKGINAGLKLASKHACSSPRVICNSGVAIRLLKCFASCPHKRKSKDVCKICTKKMVPGMCECYFRHVMPLIKPLLRNVDFSRFTKESREWNKAAYYLAKQAKMTLQILGWGCVDYKTDIKPVDFSDDLLDILLRDAFETSYYNLDELVETSYSNLDAIGKISGVDAEGSGQLVC